MTQTRPKNHAVRKVPERIASFVQRLSGKRGYYHDLLEETSQTGLSDVDNPVRPKESYYESSYTSQPSSPQSRLNCVRTNFENIQPPDQTSPLFRLKNCVMIGQGSFSVVYKGELDGREVAVKYPRETVWKRDRNMALYRANTEASILSKINHRGIVEFYHYFLEGEDSIPVIVTEMVTGYTLRSALSRPEVSQCITSGMKVRILIDLAQSVAYLHSLRPKIVHKDLKTDNVLLDLNCGVKLCDFADAEEIEGTTQVYTATTWSYAPPELVINYVKGTRHPMDEGVDVWAYGCILLETVGQRTPFEEIIMQGGAKKEPDIQPHLIYAKLQEQDHGVIPLPDLPPMIRKLASTCLQYRPSDRPTASEVVEWLLRHAKPLSDEIDGIKILNRKISNLTN